ncbi:MAG: hypothetical protein AAF907_06255, partial [Planctomycetota bacterium]
TSFRPQLEPEQRGLFLPYDLLFFDPPYKMAAGIQPGRPIYKSLKRAARPELCAAEAELVLRIPTHEEVTLPPDWKLYRTLPVGGMTFLMCDRAPVDQGETADAVEDARE